MKDDKEMKEIYTWIFIILSIIFNVSHFSGWAWPDEIDLSGNRFFGMWIWGQGALIFFYWLIIKDR